MELKDLHRMHARHLMALRRSPGTVDYYRDCVKRLGEYMTREGLTDPGELTKADMMGFTLWLRERGLQPGGESAVMRGVRATLRWAHEEELIPRNPMARLRLAQVPQVRPPHVTPENARAALKAAGKGPHPLRDKAMLFTMLDTGIRMSELLALTTDDLDLVGGFLRVRAETSKRKKERRLPVGVKATRAITTYERRERRPMRPVVTTLFLNRSGLPMTPSAIHHVLWRIAGEIGVGRAELAPHAWRRAFATSYLANGGDIATLQLLMGHATIDQVRVYLRLSDDDLQRSHMRASPGDRL